MFDVCEDCQKCNQLAISKIFLKVMTCDCCIASFRSQGEAQFLIPKFLKLYRQDGSGLCICESFHPVDLQRSPNWHLFQGILLRRKASANRALEIPLGVHNAVSQEVLSAEASRMRATTKLKRHDIAISFSASHQDFWQCTPPTLEQFSNIKAARGLLGCSKTAPATALWISDWLTALVISLRANEAHGCTHYCTKNHHFLLIVKPASLQVWAFHSFNLSPPKKS